MRLTEVNNKKNNDDKPTWLVAALVESGVSRAFRDRCRRGAESALSRLSTRPTPSVIHGLGPARSEVRPGATPSAVHGLGTARTEIRPGGARTAVAILRRRRFPCHLFDEAYIRALQTRDPETENHLIAYFSRAIQVKLRSRLRYQELVDDVSQETFKRIFTHFRSGNALNNPASLPAFVNVVCHNVMLELLRFHKRHEHLEENATEPLDPGPDPENQLVTSERQEAVRRLLEELPRRDQELLRRLLEGQDRDAVSRALHVDREYLRVLLHRALQRYKALEIWSQSGDATS
jgi:RNA polymerase sigma-70 factor (ECF subfamily)